MKKAIQLILLISLSFSCVCQKNNTTDSIAVGGKVSKPLPKTISKFSPGTFALNINITEITKNDNRYQLKATVNKRLGSGAGITHLIAVGEKISFTVNKDYDFLLDTDYSVLFKEIQSMGNQHPSLKFIKKLN